MKLWLISQSVNNNWDTYDSAVVAAETEEEARITYPDNNGISDRFWGGSKWLYKCGDGRFISTSHSCWTTPDNVRVQFLADGYNGEPGTVCASFNAG